MSNITPSRTFEITKECEYPSDYVVLDFETNGLNPQECDIIQMAAIRYRNDEKIDIFSSFVYTTSIPLKVTELTSITVEDCKSAPKLEELLPQLLNFIGDDVIVAHNASFDLSFLMENMKRLNIPGRTFIYVDTLRLARQKIKGVRWYKLPILKKYLKLEYDSHLAEDDCYVCHEVYKYCRGLSFIHKEVTSASVVRGHHFTYLPDNKGNSNLTDIFDKQIALANSLEIEGKIDEAIKIYEECVQKKCSKNAPYDRLIILYRKKRQKENEVRVLELAVQMFKTANKYRIRLNKIKG